MELYKHQLEAINKMKNGCILCGGVGTGKSLTSLGYLFEKVLGGCLGPFECVKKDIKLYIITTARKRDTLEWESEFEKFYWKKEYSVDALKEPDAVELVVDSWNNIEKYVGVKDAFFIFDEQRVVGSGKWAKTFIKISRNNKWILLSATPGDTWTDYIPVFIANGFYKNRTEFYDKHVVLDAFSKFPKIKMYINTDILENYRKKLLVTMDYKKKAVPKNTYITVNYNKELYDDIMKNLWDYEKECPIDSGSGLCSALRKVCNSDESRLLSIEHIYNQKEKVIIFYNYDYELDILRNWCKQNNINFSEWNGHKHEKIPDTDKWIYLVQYSAGAEGWNCIETDTIIFYSQNYSYKIMTQAAGRIDRLNTPFNELYYYHIRSSSPIDKRIFSTVRRKKQFNEQAFWRQEIVGLKS